MFCIHCRPNAIGTYLLKTAFPPTLHDDDTATLDDSGLTPNATLHLVRRQ